MDQLRSILAQMEFTHEICQHERFRMHLYVPEGVPVPAISDDVRDCLPYHEREDEPHLLKV